MGERARRAIVFDRSCRTRPTPPRRREFDEGEDRGTSPAAASAVVMVVIVTLMVAAILRLVDVRKELAR